VLVCLRKAYRLEEPCGKGCQMREIQSSISETDQDCASGTATKLTRSLSWNASNESSLDKMPSGGSGKHSNQPAGGDEQGNDGTPANVWGSTIEHVLTCVASARPSLTWGVTERRRKTCLSAPQRHTHARTQPHMRTTHACAHVHTCEHNLMHACTHARTYLASSS